VELEAIGELTPRNLTQTGRREITHLLRSHDLTVSAISCPLRRGLDVAENLEPRLEQIREAMQLAFDLGPRLVLLPLGKIGEPSRVSDRLITPSTPSPPAPLPQGERREILMAPLPQGERADSAALLKESLTALGKHGDRIGVLIALDAGFDDPAHLVAYLQQFDTGSVNVNYNAATLITNGFNPYDAITILDQRLIHAHAQDARRVSPSKLATVPVGHGDVDWFQLAAQFEQINYHGQLTVLANDRHEAGAGLAFLRRFVA
jgi:sugar phosphate isomerase/epimerase